ncbi:MAG: hypothetical protein HY328_11250 [Chloroflexi bacterium]|nr:hypothetical protein [Chloroflexota bacterium]
MKIVMDRGLCDATLNFCARCSATYFQKPMGTDRPCVVNVIDDGKEDVLEFFIRSEGHTVHFVLTDELQEGLALEGWEFLADFDPALFRTGAAERWRKIAKMPAARSVHTHG